MKKYLKIFKWVFIIIVAAVLVFYLYLFPRATSQADMLACPFGDCREGQIPRSLGRYKIDAPLLAAGFLTRDSIKEYMTDRSSL